MNSMDRVAVGWLHRTAIRNHWRVAAWYGLDDLIQDGYLHWCRVVTKYPHVTAPAHRMRLFQVTYTYWLHDLAKRKQKQPDVPISSIVTEDSQEVHIVESTAPDTELSSATALLGNIPPRVEYLLELILKTPITPKRLERLLKSHKRIAKETRQFLLSE